METFSYTPLDLGRPAFRLLQLLQGEGPIIECLLHQVFLDGADTVPYNALSYTWGGTEKISSVIVDGKILSVTENLYIALQHFRLKDVDQILWIDAICIDQDNLRERGHQVQHMCKIYSQAEEVTVWLGSATDETDMIMDSLSRLEEYSSIYGDWDLAHWTQFWRFLPQSTTSNPCKGIQLLLQRPWFRRVWILQEIANAKRASVWCGTKCIKAHTFTLAPKIIGVRPERHCQAALDIMPGRLREESWWIQSRDLHNLLLKFKDSEATDSRDKVYALLGISSDTQGTDLLRPDYEKSPEEVVRDTCSFLFGPSGDSCETFSELVANVMSKNASSFCQLIKTSDASDVGKFLMRRGLEVPVSEDMMIGAAGNQAFGRDVMALLIRHRGNEVKVTEEVIKAAVGNEASGRDIIALLLQHSGNKVKVTEEVIKVAVGNEVSGMDIITLLLRQCGSKAKVTEEVIKAIAGNEASGRDVITVLFQQRRREGRMAEVIEAAVENGKSGDWIIEHINTLQEAWKEGHWTTVNALFDKSADINKGWGPLSSVLYTTSERGHKAAVELLLGVGADPNVQGGKYGSALQAASYGGHMAVVRLLLDAGAKANVKGGEYGYALYAASREGHEVVAKMLLDAGAEVNAQDGHYGNALYAASREGCGIVVKILLDAGAEVNAKGGRYRNALQAASYRGHEAIVKLLVEKGADPNAQGGYFGNALQAASYGGYKAIVKLLVEKGAEINAQGGSLGNALQAASYGGHKAIVKLLVKKGAKVNARGGYFGNAFRRLHTEGYEATVKQVLDAGADVNTQGGESSVTRSRRLYLKAIRRWWW